MDTLSLLVLILAIALGIYGGKYLDSNYGIIWGIVGFIVFSL